MGSFSGTQFLISYIIIRMSNFIKFFLNLECNLKLYHWQTDSYARHKATDELVDKVSEYKDRFIEVYFGKYGKQKISKDCKIALMNQTDADILKFLDSTNKEIITIRKQLEQNGDNDLVSILDDLAVSINQTIYLYSFN